MFWFCELHFISVAHLIGGVLKYIFFGILESLLVITVNENPVLCGINVFIIPPAPS